MKILKQLSSFFFVFLVCNPINNIKANEPVDIWNIEKTQICLILKLLKLYAIHKKNKHRWNICNR